jgi:hypothetical protein
MDCWHCKRSAVGVCRFCGRGICEDHLQTHPYILELFRTGDVPKVLIVEDALFCGACTPAPTPSTCPNSTPCDVRHRLGCDGGHLTSGDARHTRAVTPGR